MTRTAEEIGRTALGPRPLPPLGTQRPPADLSSVDTVLGNGLRVLAVHLPTVPMVELRMRIPFAAPDPDAAAKHAAVAELLAETVLTGTARRDRVAVDTDLALVGGELSASVDPQRLSFAGGALATGLDTLLDVLGDALTGASYADAEVARERDRLVEHIALAGSQPSVIARKALQRHRYGNHPFVHETPEADDVAAATADEVKALHTAAVLPRGAVLVVVGDLAPDAAVAAVEKALGGWTSEATALVMPPLPELAGGDMLLVPRAGAVQSQLRLSAQSIPRTDPRYPALQLANLAFGGFFSSRLVENIREDKGYTYHARSGPEFARGSATLQVDADTASEVTGPALLEIRYELGKFAVLPPTQDELDTVRQYAVGSLLIATSSQPGMASQLVSLAEQGLGTDWLLAHPGRLQGVTLEQIGEAARQFFAPGRFTGVVVGDPEVLAGLDVLGGVRQ